MEVIKTERKGYKEINPPTLFQLTNDIIAIRRIVKALDSMLVNHLTEFLKDSLRNDPKEVVIEKMTELLKMEEICFTHFPGEMISSYLESSLVEGLLKEEAATTLEDWKYIYAKLECLIADMAVENEESIAGEVAIVKKMVGRAIKRVDPDFWE